MAREVGEQPFVSIRNLSKHYGAFQALRDINLDVSKDEFVSFLGPSGCGKTTLLRAIAGLDLQSAGEIRINGRDVSKAPPAERDFGIVFQSYALFPNLTVEANIGYGLVNQKKSRAEIAAQEGLNQSRDAVVNLRYSPVREDGLGTALRRLAAKARQKEGMNLSIEIDEPAALLADEKTEAVYRIIEEALRNAEHHAEALEVSIRARVLREEARGGRAVLLISHRPALIESADRVVRIGEAA